MEVDEDGVMWEEDATDTQLMSLITSVAAVMSVPIKRNSSIFDQRLDWDAFCYKHVTRGSFKIRLRMPKESFDKLLGYIAGMLVTNELKARVRGGPIIPELCLYCTLRWLAGGSYLDITDISGISTASFYRIIWKTITAIVKAPELAIHFPSTSAEIEAAMIGFASISDEQVISNCVGVIDGYLMRIKVPNLREVTNQKAFFSGHYQCYGVNVQAMADHHSRFSFIAMCGPGVMNDDTAMSESPLGELVESLPFHVCVIGDAAYIPTEHMIPIYQGADKEVKKYDDFNFFASQCRIRVEMAFGLLQMIWGILQRPVGVSFANLKWMIQALGRLHNFVINERLARSDKEEFDPAKANVPRYIPTVPNDENGDPISLDELFSGTHPGHSHLREYMAGVVEKKRMHRPKGGGYC